MKTNKRYGCLALLISAGFLAGIAAGCGNARKAEAEDAAHAPTAPVVKVARRNLSNTLEIASEFQPLQEIEVYAKVSGYIKSLYVDWGTHVKKGQLLAELEIPELQQQLQQDEAGARRSDQDLSRAREELNRAQSAYTVAHLTYTRLAEVQKSRPELMAQEEVDTAQGKDLEASAGVSSARDAVSAAEQGLLAAKAALGKDQAMFAYARITAPFDGVVTKIYAYTGALLPAGTSSNKGDLALCQLSQNNILRLVIPSRKEPSPIFTSETPWISRCRRRRIHSQEKSSDFPIKSTHKRAPCTPKSKSQIQNICSSPECMLP